MPLSLLVAVSLSACGGGDAEDPLACIDPNDPRASDPALRGDLEICPAVGTAVGTAPAQPVDGSCPAAEVAAWRVTIRYDGELGATSSNGRRRLEHHVAADLHALLTMQRNASSAGADWAPTGKVTHQMREYDEGELVLQVEGEGAPVAGNSTTITDSRILLSIDPRACTYNLYSTGTVISQITRGDETSTDKAGYGTIIASRLPATLSIAESRRLPVVEESFDPQIDMPDLYIPAIGTQPGDGVLVSWQIEPVAQ